MKNRFFIICLAVIGMIMGSCATTGTWTCQPPSGGNYGGSNSTGSYDTYGYSTNTGLHGYDRPADLVRADFNLKPTVVEGDQYFFCGKLGGYVKGDPLIFCDSYNAYKKASNTPKYSLKNYSVNIPGRQIIVFYFA